MEVIVMPKHCRKKISPKDEKLLELMQEKEERNKSQIDYIAMMTDVEIPEEEEIEGEQEL